MIFIDYQDSRPIYEQIVERFEKLILTGAVMPDSRLPSVRQLASDLSINPNTIQKAYTILEKEGYIYRETVERDARLKKIVPTEKTKELHGHIISNIRYMEALLRKDIPREELEVCIHVLERMSANLADYENDRGKETTKHE